jgi:succinoglycan biosynthesis transport protein ExoP
MDSHSKQSPGSGPSENAQGGYGYGYGYPGYGYGESSAQRSLNDYLLILRERVWYVVVVFLVVFSSALVYTFSQTKIYESNASVQVLRQDPRVMQTEAVVDTTVRSTEDLNTLVKVMESQLIIDRVNQRITGEDLRQFMAPYEKGRWGDPLTPREVLGQNRRITPLRLSLVVAVSYRHPDPIIAARIANMFVDELIQWNSRVRIDDTIRGVEDLQIRVEQQRKRVQEQALALQAYREKNDMVSLDQRKDIVTERLKQLSLFVAQAEAKRNESETRWNQVQARKDSKEDLAKLPFIAQLPLVSQLTQQVASQKIAFAQLRERYRDKHPKMIEASNSLAQAERELTRAISSAASSIEAEHENAKQVEFEAVSYTHLRAHETLS